MAIVNSVLGPLDTSDLGFTLTHEHILTSSAGFRYTYPELVDRQRVEDVAVDLLIKAREEGVGTIVDCTPMDLDRDVGLIKDRVRAQRRQHHLLHGKPSIRTPRLFSNDVRVDESHAGGHGRVPLEPGNRRGN